ncbi:MAG: glycosyltransferase 87 family protein [Propionicimonas sp.]|uniref:glycosyltransferase 87 family protein n=1 Tax=Propionicimonas sp. TaxID=1955623 RepID=UPI003D1428C2
MRRVREWVTPQRLAMLGIAVVAVALRWWFVGFVSGDFQTFLSRWWTYLATHGHLAGLADDSFSNYNTPYLVLLALATYLPVRAIVAIKAISIAGDLVLAWVASRIVATVRPGSAWAPVAGFGVVLFLPTVVMNSGVWAQCDSLYAAACLACMLFLMKGRPRAASAWFGVAFAFKLQAVFLLPVLIGVVAVNRHRWRTLLAAPATFLACLVPALLAGRSLVSQLMVYPLQVTDSSGTGGTVGGGGTRGGGAGGLPGGGPGGQPSGGPGAPPSAGAGGPLPSGGAGGGAGGPGGPGGGSGGPGGGSSGFTLNVGQSFTHNAPTPYAWLPADASVAWKYAGPALTAAVVIGFGAWLLARQRRLTASQVLLVAACCALVVPLLLPEMHERYFYLAEVLLVLAAFVEWRFALPALGIQLASTSTYLAYLLDTHVVPLAAAAAVAAASGLAAVALLVLALRDRDVHHKVDASAANSP